MPWFKVDDTFPHHAKVLAAGNSAVGLWVRAGAWAMQQLTDGFIPTHVASTLGSKKEADRLVAVGLWTSHEDGYRFHQWTDVQRTREQVHADRNAATERQRRAREASKSRSESRRDEGVSHGPPDQTRPDQPLKNISSAVAEVPDTFDAWWSHYPRKEDKGHARKAYKAASKKVSTDVLLTAVQSFAIVSRGVEKRFIPLAATWLNGERWDDQLEAGGNSSRRADPSTAWMYGGAS